MTFTGLAIAFVLVCTWFGLARAHSQNTALAAALAAVMACVQFALLLSR